MNSDGAAIPPDFEEALLSLRGHRQRPEIRLEEVPAPTRIAPYALALTAEVNAGVDPETMLGNGRFVVLHDPDGQPAWDGTFRVVVMARATLEDELGGDPMLGEVGWTWLVDALADCGVGYHSLSGTVTRVLSESFGGISLEDRDVELEIRASWSPNTTDLGPHLAAWVALLGSTTGLEPLPQGVTALVPRR